MQTIINTLVYPSDYDWGIIGKKMDSFIDFCYGVIVTEIIIGAIIYITLHL